MMSTCKTHESYAPILLDDEQVRGYIANGYIKIELSLSGELHEAIARKLDSMHERGPNLGNNLLPHASW